MNEKVSVIVPVHNVEDYLEKCINSLLQQTYENVEIILVENNSTDSSYSIAKMYSENFRNIKCIRSKKKGVGAARNIGIENSTGDFIAFVDADDYVTKDYIYELVNPLNSKFCMTMTTEYFIIRDTLQKHCYDKNNDKSIISSKELMNNLSRINGGGYSVNKLFRKDLIRRSNIMFDENVRILEDFLFCIEYLNSCDESDVYLLKKPLYYYTQRSNSVSHSKKSKIEPTKLNALEKILKISKKETNLNIDIERDYINLLVAVSWDNKFKKQRFHDKWRALTVIMKKWKLLTNKHKIATVLLFLCLTINNS